MERMITAQCQGKREKGKGKSQGKGTRTNSAFFLFPLALFFSLFPFPFSLLAAQPPAAVLPGIEVFLSNPPPELRGKRVGLITNHTGIDRTKASIIDLFAAHKDFKLVALLAPEHGIRGDVAAGVKVGDEV